MDWLSNNWLFFVLVVCVVILLAVFGRRGGHAHGAGGCCGSMERGKQESDAPAPRGHGH
jgi:hypothetical protein